MRQQNSISKDSQVELNAGYTYQMVSNTFYRR